VPAAPPTPPAPLPLPGTRPVVVPTPAAAAGWPPAAAVVVAKSGGGHDDPVYPAFGAVRPVNADSPLSGIHTVALTPAAVTPVVPQAAAIPQLLAAALEPTRTGPAHLPADAFAAAQDRLAGLKIHTPPVAAPGPPPPPRYDLYDEQDPTAAARWAEEQQAHLHTVYREYDPTGGIRSAPGAPKVDTPPSLREARAIQRSVSVPVVRNEVTHAGKREALEFRLPEIHTIVHPSTARGGSGGSGGGGGGGSATSRLSPLPSGVPASPGGSARGRSSGEDGDMPLAPVWPMWLWFLCGFVVGSPSLSYLLNPCLSVSLFSPVADDWSRRMCGLARRKTMLLTRILTRSMKRRLPRWCRAR
jgi:hypothetical protein